LGRGGREPEVKVVKQEEIWKDRKKKGGEKGREERQDEVREF
jgi:hypothetical protein